jgi:hypothetical protein
MVPGAEFNNEDQEAVAAKACQRIAFKEKFGKEE